MTAQLSRLLPPRKEQRLYSLRIKIVLLIVTPIIAAFVLLSILHYNTGQELVEELVLNKSVELGDLLLRSMYDSMLNNDAQQIDYALSSISVLNEDDQAWVINLQGQVRHSTNQQDNGDWLQTTQPDCAECHTLPASIRPRAIRTTSGDTLRISTPIRNDPECYACHPSENLILGTLLIDTSISAEEQKLLEVLGRNLMLSLLFTVLIAILSFFLINRLVVQRIESLHKTMSAYISGNMGIRQAVVVNTPDELTELMRTFNELADRIAIHEREQQQITIVRQKAIVEERDRIARELHDGVAQFIGYVNTKTMAARVLLEKQQLEAADFQLIQIGEAVQEQAFDIRSSIIGLKLASQTGSGLVNLLNEHIMQCNRLSDLQITFETDEASMGVHLDAETELHLAHILQESISNIRKHSKVDQARVSVSLIDNMLRLVIRDEGIGFNPWQWSGNQMPHFGLQTMRERAEIVNASFSLISEPGRGVTIEVSLKIEES